MLKRTPQSNKITPDMIRKNAIALLFMLDEAIKSIHPDRFPFEDEFIDEVMTYLFMLNNFLGRDPLKCKSPVSYDDIYDRLIFYTGKGLFMEILEAAKPVPLMDAILRGVLHDARLSIMMGQSHNRENLGHEVKSTVCHIIDMVNRASSNQG